jgi:hypothetical protein
MHFHTRALRHIRDSLPDDVANTVACAIVGSRLNYCNSLLPGTSRANLNKLQRAQNSVSRVVGRTRRMDHITPTQKSLHWLPVRFRIVYKVALTVFKVRQSREPAYLASLVREKPHIRDLRSNDKYLLDVPRCRGEIARRAFRSAAPAVWNNLPLAIRARNPATATVVNFKQLKTHFFGLAFFELPR